MLLQLVFQKGVNICVIDPWNMLDHSAQRILCWEVTFRDYPILPTSKHSFVLVAHKKNGKC